jgi:hypothetical protein
VSIRVRPGCRGPGTRPCLPGPALRPEPARTSSALVATRSRPPVLFIAARRKARTDTEAGPPVLIHVLRSDRQHQAQDAGYVSESGRNAAQGCRKCVPSHRCNRHAGLGWQVVNGPVNQTRRQASLVSWSAFCWSHRCRLSQGDQWLTVSGTRCACPGDSLGRSVTASALRAAKAAIVRASA